MTRTGPHQSRLPSSNLRTRTIFLVGFMGAGKTSVGEHLSRLLGRRFHDLDVRIETREGRTVGQIFRESGEGAFRCAETEALTELLQEVASAPAVAALGGGAFARNENRALLQNSGALVIFLDAPVEELWRRSQGEKKERPLMQDPQQFRQLYEERRSFYEIAELCIDTGAKDVAAVAEEIALQLELNHDSQGEVL